MSEREHIRKTAPTRLDISQRVKSGRFTYPFGSYPENDFIQKTGYDSKYIRDGGYFYYQISLSHERILPAFTKLVRLVLPEKAYLVTQIHTDDYYNENDTYISENHVETEDLLKWVYEWRDVALDDGFFGIGAFTDEPTAEVFLDEHKFIHVYHTDPEKMEKTLEEMGIPFILDMKLFWDEPHYHEPLPLVNDFSEDYLTAFEDLADRYDLRLDEDDDGNTDDEGDPLGITCWRVDIRGFSPKSKNASIPQGFYSTVYLNAQSRSEAIDVVEQYMEFREEFADLYLQMARVPSELLTSELGRKNLSPGESCVWYESERVEFDWDQPIK